MPIVIEGRISLPPSKNRTYGNEERMRVIMERKENVIRSKHKKYPLAIEIDSGKLVDGKDIFDRMRADYMQCLKSCPTCDFKITCAASQNTDKEYFHPLTLRNERLHYTLRGGKEVEISRSYNSYNGNLDGLASIRINNKFLPPMPGLDFNKFKDLSHLNQRLSTLVVFG